MTLRMLRENVQRAVAPAGVTLDGPRPWDPRIHDERVFRRVLLQGSLGLGEAWMDGWWDCEQLDELFHRLLGARVEGRFHSAAGLLGALRGRLLNLQRRVRAREVARRHYDLGRDLFEAMLGRHPVYSCGYWRRASDLDEAQEAKLALVCEKLQLEPGMRVLDVGCGWGEAARFAARRHQVEVVGVTLSSDQVEVARELCRGLPVRIELRDYCDVEGRFDRIFSLGMFEHVGVRNYRRFMRSMRALLEPDGLLLLHSIGSLRSGHAGDPWMERYIFPNSMLPSAAQITRAFEGLFVLEDWHGFGADYDPTLMAWHENFQKAWPRLAGRYDERFRRMWSYYLLSCAGGFRARRHQLWQLVLSPGGVPGGYASVR